MESNLTSPVLADSAPLNNTRLGIHSSLLPYSHNGSAFSPTLFLTIPRRRTGILDDVRCNIFDAMKSSSPTHNTLTKETNTEITTLSDVDIAYRNWLFKYPSALGSFEQLANNAKGKRVALFLDYDGTLSPIVDNPDHAFMSNAMRAAVSNVAKYFPTAIISGRSRDKVYEFVGLTELYYAGSHGMDIMGPVRSSSSDYRNCIKSSDKQISEVKILQSICWLSKFCSWRANITSCPWSQYLSAVLCILFLVGYPNFAQTFQVSGTVSVRLWCSEFYVILIFINLEAGF